MTPEEYRLIHSRLRNVKDIQRLNRELGASEETLMSILSQKLINNTKKKHPFVKKNIEAYARRWSYGQSFLYIARKIRFSPVMTASMIMKWDGMSKKQISALLANPAEAPNDRLKKELTEVITNDIVFSPESIAARATIGSDYEARLGVWLDERAVAYISEDEARARGYKKTPDFLIESESPLIINGMSVAWVDSKASFGDPHEVKHDYHSQLKHYLTEYGPGLVVYWFGFVDDIEMDDIILVDGERLDHITLEK